MPLIINHFLLPQREEGRKEQGQKMGKGINLKVSGERRTAGRRADD